MLVRSSCIFEKTQHANIATARMQGAGGGQSWQFFVTLSGWLSDPFKG